MLSPCVCRGREGEWALGDEEARSLARAVMALVTLGPSDMERLAVGEAMLEAEQMRYVGLCVDRGQPSVQSSRGATGQEEGDKMMGAAPILLPACSCPRAVGWGVGHRQFAEEAKRGRRVKRGGKAALLGSATSGVQRWQARPYIPHPFTATLARLRTAGRRSIDSAGEKGVSGARGSVSAARGGDGKQAGVGTIKGAGEGSGEALSGAKNQRDRGTSPSPSRPASRCVKRRCARPLLEPAIPALSCPITVPSLA